MWPLTFEFEHHHVSLWAGEKEQREQAEKECWVGLGILWHLVELHLTKNQTDQPCIHKTHPPMSPSTNTIASTQMGCPFDVKPSTHTPCYSIHGCYMLYLTDDSQHIHVSPLPLYMGKSSNAGSWPQVSGHNGREVHCCVKPCLVRSYISFPKQGPAGSGLELREYSAAVKELKWLSEISYFRHHSLLMN